MYLTGCLNGGGIAQVAKMLKSHCVNNHRMKRYSLVLILVFISLSVWSTNYYINALMGSDNNSGLKESDAFKSLDKMNTIRLKAGDKILLAEGQTFKGSLILQSISGEEGSPVMIEGYSTDKTSKTHRPVIDACGFLNGIFINNCSHIELRGIEISANGGENKTIQQQKQMRCGVLVTTSEPGQFINIRLSDLVIRDVFYEEPGFERGADEVKTANGRQNYGWGIRFINITPDAQLNNLTVENCHISNVAHTGIKFTGKDKNIQNIHVFDNRILETGGPGIQMSEVHQGHVKGNQVNSSGSNNDSRKWGRGSGLWTWGSSNVIIEHNTFKNANGPGDSAGCHIDYNCNNVIVQCNLSVNNAGGFCEILGNNYNCAYRYNVSVNDGYRVKGENGAFQEGKILWLSGYRGKRERSGPFNSYFYNNTIYVGKGIVAKIAIDRASTGLLIANNIFCIKGDSKAVLGDQYNPEKSGSSKVRDIVFKNNLYLKKNNWPDEVLIEDENPFYGNPQFANAEGQQLIDYRPLKTNLIKDKGVKITLIPNDSIGIYIGLEVPYDILGNKIKALPDLGAIEVD